MILSSTAPAAEPKQNVADGEIATALESALLFETSVPSYRIDTSVIDGVATLSRTVKGILAKERALMAAKATRGVRSVVDKIEVNPPKRSDAELAKDVNNALLLDPAADSYEVDVTAKDGVVTLKGTVDSWQERKLAAHVAKGVRGVSEVVDEMMHNYDLDRSDSELQAEIERAMEIDVILRPLFITTEVEDREVKLTGTVGSSAEKDRAINKAFVMGVREVDATGLEVDSWASTDIKKEGLPVIKSDEEIKEAVKDAFLYDPRVFSFNPNVSVNSGMVTLTGTVDNLKAKEAAERDARNTVGVWRVKNHLKVRTPETIPDSTVKANLDSALAWNAITESYEIDSEVENGIVTLTGTVDSFLEKAEAEDVADRTNGALVVKNKLKVDLPDLTYYSYTFDPLWSTAPYHAYNNEGEMTYPAVSDAEIVEDVEDELFWSPFVDSDDISVTAKQGDVTLTGEVDDWSEFTSATENAYEGGAATVVNKLEIK